MVRSTFVHFSMNKVTTAVNVFFARNVTFLVAETTAWVLFKAEGCGSEAEAAETVAER